MRTKTATTTREVCQSLVGRRRLIVGLMVSVVLLGLSGCNDIVDFGGGNDAPKKEQVAEKKNEAKPKTVVINKGLSKKEEKKLNDRLDELERKVEEQDKQTPENTTTNSPPTTTDSQPEQPEQQVEDQVRAAAEAYYAAVEVRAWGYTYDHLDSETQSAYTKNEWFAKNEWLANTGFVTYTIQSVEMDASAPDTLANVVVVLTTTDGSTSIRNTYFVYEDGIWKHRFGTEEYNLLASAGTASASASASVSASPSATVSSAPSPNPSPKPSPNRNRNGKTHNPSGKGLPSRGGSGGDIDCDQVAGPIQTPPGDPDNLDADGDGIACEDTP